MHLSLHTICAQHIATKVKIRNQKITYINTERNKVRVELPNQLLNMHF